MSVLKKLENEVKMRMTNESAHDFEHIMRVYKNAKKITGKEKANAKNSLNMLKLLLPSCRIFPLLEKLRL